MEPYIAQRRLGQFGVSYELMKDSSWFILALQKDIIIVGAKLYPKVSQILYTGVSKYFEILRGDERIPFYSMRVMNESPHSIVDVCRIGYFEDQLHEWERQEEEKNIRRITILNG